MPIHLTFFCAMLPLLLSAQNPETTNKFGHLEQTVGEWAVSANVRLSAQGPWELSTGLASIQKTLEGHVLEENFTGSRQGKTFHAKSLTAINNLNNKLQRVFMDSEHGGTIVDYEGQREGENRFVFDKIWTYPNGNTVKLRFVYTIISDHEFTEESMRMPQGTEVWDTTSKLTYKRK